MTQFVCKYPAFLSINRHVFSHIFILTHTEEIVRETVMKI